MKIEKAVIHREHRDHREKVGGVRRKLDVPNG